ncbi:hypothetical protein EDD16DRAFT_1498342, partial [Pisolithus croceorrhizus]
PSQPMCITTESYCLSKAPITGVLELCDIFKVRHLHQSQNLTNANVREKLPHSAGAHMPAWTPGHVVPGQIWQTPLGYWTPSVYAHATPTATNGTAPTSYSSGHEPTMCCHDPELG